MNKNKKIEEVTNLLSKALRHRIGARVMPGAYYAKKYERDADVLIHEAKKESLELHLNINEKAEFERILKEKAQKELQEKEFLPDKKFELVDEEVDAVLKELGLM